MADSMESRDFDMILFGASGYTGKYVIEELALSSLQANIKWAIAGRNTKNLQESLHQVQSYLGQCVNILETTIIEADVKDYPSLLNMCKRTKLIMNCVGPYKFYGESVVKACIETKTHHLDLSGEPKFLETVQASYFDRAQQNGVYIIQACGFESIPSDYGVALLKNKFSGDLNSVKYYVSIGDIHDLQVNTGTFISAIHSITDGIFTTESDKLLKESVFKKVAPKNKYAIWRDLPIFYNSDVKSWCLWFLGAEPRILERSQNFSYEYLNERPVQIHGYLQMPSFFTSLTFLFGIMLLAVMSMFSVGKYLLAKFPYFFTAGTVQVPRKEKNIEEGVKLTLFGKGWKDKLLDSTDQHMTKPDTDLKLTITGPGFAYTCTAICMVQAALTVLYDHENMPLRGGVLTPGVAFQKTTLRERLEKRGMRFEFEIP